MIKMLESDKPDDYAISTGEAHSVREFVECAFDFIGLDINIGDINNDDHRLQGQKAQ